MDILPFSQQAARPRPFDVTGRDADAGGTIEYIRPGKVGFAWLRDTIGELKRGDPFRRVTILAPSAHVARQARWAAAETGFVGVQTARLTTVATAIVAEAGGETRVFLNRVREDGALRIAVAEQPEFRDIDHPSLRRALLTLFRQARREEIDLDHSGETGSPSGTDGTNSGADLPSRALRASGNPSRVSVAAAASFRRFVELTAPYADYIEVMDRAAIHLAAAERIPATLEDAGCLIFLYPGRVGLAETRFLAAAARWVPVRVALATVADDASSEGNADIGDAESERVAARLAAAFGVAPTRPHFTPRQPEIRVSRMPDSAEEVLDVVRAIAADCHAGIPFHRVAVLYRQRDPYAGLVRDGLDAAGFPWVTAEGRSLAQSRPGRCLLALLRLVADDFPRETLIGWLESGPTLPDSIRSLDVSIWRRVSRQVRVPRGRDEWPRRLRAYAGSLERDEARRPGRDRPGTDSASTVRAMADVIEDLGLVTAPPVDDRSWSGLVRWTRGLFDRFVGDVSRWDVETLFASDIVRAIDDLVELDALNVPSGGVAEFVATLEAVLGERTRPLGAFGDGVFVGALSSARGLAFERVYILGLVEGAFPPPPPIDPFFPGAPDGHPLDRRGRHREDERHTFLSALAAGDGGVVALSAPAVYGGRAAFASSYLLECVASRLGHSVSAAEFATLSSRDHAWLRVVRSAVRAASALDCSAGHSAAERVPAHLDDVRFASVAEWHRRSGSLAGHALTTRADLPLARGLTTRRSRWSDEFSEFDGNVAERVAVSRRVTRRLNDAVLASATSLETWATCPYRHFLKNVLGIAETRAPADEWTISALERGSLYHAILARYFTETHAESDATALRTILDRVITEELSATEGQGMVGVPLAWEKVRRNAYTDLHGYVAEDASRRATSGRQPRHFEQKFGDLGGEDGSAWPPLDLEANGVTIRLRGVIDRVDVAPDGRDVGVYDYKTGRGQRYGAIKTDPVDAGQHLQLALYSRVARRQFGSDIRVETAYLCVDAAAEYGVYGPRHPPDEVDARLDTVLRSIDRGIRGGVFPRVPGDDGWKSYENCQYCPYDRVCPARRDEQWERKQSHPAIRSFLELSLDRADGVDPVESDS